jgi:chromosome partitioning protein
MPVITFANTKGGAGKTTAVLLIGIELARMGYRVTILDADPQQWITHWKEATAEGLAHINVIPYVTVANIGQHILEERQRCDYLLIDLPGARNTLLATAVGYADHVLIPIQGSHMDAQGGAHVIELLQYLREKSDIRIPFSVILSRVNPMVTTRALGAVKDLLSERGVHILDTPIIERAAYRDVFGSGGTLYTIDPGKTSNLIKAQDNARALSLEVARLVPVQNYVTELTGEPFSSAA